MVYFICTDFWISITEKELKIFIQSSLKEGLFIFKIKKNDLGNPYILRYFYIKL